MLVLLVLQGLQLKRHIDATLGQGNLIEAVRLPPGEDIQEWLAVNTVDFYNAISVLYSTLAEFCTDRSCEVMSAGSKVCVCAPCGRIRAVACCCMCVFVMLTCLCVTCKIDSAAAGRPAEEVRGCSA